MNPVRIAALVWFERHDYARFREVLPDRSWHATYEAWLEQAQDNLRRLENQGIRAIKAHIHSDDFVAWCTAAGVDINTQALTAMANEIAARNAG